MASQLLFHRISVEDLALHRARLEGFYRAMERIDVLILASYKLVDDAFEINNILVQFDLKMK